LTTYISWIEERIQGNGPVVVIDGGMGTELEKSGVPMDRIVWSGKAVLSHPEIVQHVHEEFILAGAEAIIANTFAAARHVLEPGGLGEHVKEMNINAVKLAQQARDRVADGSVAVVGSVCEWVSTEDHKWASPEAVAKSSREQVKYLVEAGVDIIALEMCQKTEFSARVIDAAIETGLLIWIGVSAKTHKGAQSLSVFDYAELSFENLIKNLSQYPAMIMNIMHTPVSDIDESLRIVKKYWDGPIGIYPESGFFTMPNWQFIDVIDPDVLTQKAKIWMDDLSVRLVGGCCGLGPAHIKALKQYIDRKPKISI